MYREAIMLALVIGVLLILFTAFAALPQSLFGLGWGGDILLFLRGGLPIFTAFVGLIAVFIGIADIKDRKDAKREEIAMKAEDESVK